MFVSLMQKLCVVILVGRDSPKKRGEVKTKPLSTPTFVVCFAPCALLYPLALSSSTALVLLVGLSWSVALVEFLPRELFFFVTFFSLSPLEWVIVFPRAEKIVGEHVKLCVLCLLASCDPKKEHQSKKKGSRSSAASPLTLMMKKFHVLNIFYSSNRT